MDTASGTKIFIDAALFLGMHSRCEAIRRACKNFVVLHLARPVFMSLEHVGWCDEVVWGYSRELQDLYYPFMDRLHTEMDIHRIPYEEQDLHRALKAPILKGLELFDRLLLAQILNQNGLLYTVNPCLLTTPGLPVVGVGGATQELPFPETLDKSYEVSLALRI